MRRSFSFGSFLLGLVVLGCTASCARANNAAAIEATTLSAFGTPPAYAAVAIAPQTTGFITVEGADLRAKLDAAASRARASRTPYWSAYAFDVRPGVAVDPGGGEFHGSMNTSGGTTVFVGSSRGMTVETRNLAVFLLRDGAGGAVTRMEIYNLDRKREYSGYPVYWLGRAANEESLNYLRGLAETTPAPTSTTNAGLLNQHAVLAVGLHDDPRVAAMLKSFIGSSRNPKVRSTSVYWLGQVGGETEFLANIVRNNGETKDLRRQAAHAIGESRDRAALTILQSLYEGVVERDVKRGIIHAVSGNENKEAATAFLLKVAKTDTDKESRRTAVHALGEDGGDAVIDQLAGIMSNDPDTDVRRAVLHAFAEIKTPRAQAKILEAARTGSHPDLRRHAIHMLAEVEGEAMIDELIKLYDTEQSNDMRRQILHAFGEMKSTRAEDKLFAVARDASGNADLRRHAIHMIGERAGKRSLDLLRETVESSSAETQIQMQAVHAISERPAEESVPLLIKVARTHPNQQVRRRAIHVLGESGDPRALEFFREVLRSEKE
ncbi:MAG TPA: HEAT repeat domain-containing protein [Pyrinomonadaceae bacterium]|nr:HEAT repeat domain-containing protein [Pyrinomonadaceae bacterium]